jgi:transglycosylase-like protein with SLT domain
MPPRPDVPYSPVPGYTPQESAPRDYIDAQASPNAFGAQIGQAEEQGGQRIQQTGDQATDLATRMQTFYNEAATQSAQDQWMSKSNDVLHNPQTGFYAQKGGAALSAYQPSLDALDSSRTEIRAGLANDRQRLMFDQLTRRMYDYQVQGMGAHVDQEGQKYATGQLQGSIENNIRSASLAWNQDGPNSLFDLNLGQAMGKTQNLGETMGWSQDQIDAKKAETTSRAWHARISMAMDQDLPYAEKLLQSNGDKLDPQLKASLQGQLQVKQYTAQQRDLPVQAQALARNYLGQQYQSPPEGSSANPSIPVGQLTEAIKGQESGNNPNVGMSVNGAVGVSQITPATWARYAKPGELITNPNDNAAVGQRIVTDLYNKYNGDPQRVAVAYFSGEGNVAPQGSATPWVRDVSDGNGKSVSSYVTDVSNRVGAFSKAGLKTDEATVLAKIDQDYAGNPQLGHMISQEVQRQYSIVNMGVAAQAAQNKDASDKAAGNYTQQILNRNFDGLPDKIANDPDLEWQTKWHLHEMAAGAMKQESAGDTKTYGPGFWDAFQKIHAAPGTDGRITDPNQLYALGGLNGSLTVAGIDKLNGELQGRKTTDGVAESDIRKGALTYAKHQLSFEQDYGYMKIPDPKGEDAFNIGFTPAFYKYWDDGLKAGKSPQELANKDEIDKVIHPFKRDDTTMLQDRFNAGIETNDKGKSVATPESFDLKTAAGIVAAYNAHQLDPTKGISKADAEAAARAAGFISQPAAPTRPQVPLAGP